MEAEVTSAGPTLASYLRVLRRRAWILVLCLLIIPLAAMFFAERGVKLYAASAEIFTNQTSFAPALTGIQATSATSSLTTGAENMVYLSLTPRVARRTLQALHRNDRTPSYLLAQTTVSQKGSSDFFAVSVTDTDPAVAMQLATAYARQIVIYSNQLATSAITNARRLIARKLNELEADGKENSALHSSLEEKDQELETLEALQTSRLSVVRTPTAAYQIAPRPKRAAGLGIFLGLVVGVGLMLVIEALDTRVRSGSEIAERLDLPLLARIPAPPRKLAAADELVMLTKPTGQHGETFRILRTNLEFALLSGRTRTILLTSAVQKEGKSTTAGNLAVALARGGRRVALVDLDLRRPYLNKFFRIPSTPGITDVALGRATLEDALVRIDLGTGQRAKAQREEGGSPGLTAPGSLDVLASGPLPPDPGEFVGTNRLSEILHELGKGHDLVVIDSPPMLRVGDVMTLSTKVDALLVISRLNVVRRPALAEFHRLLDSIPIAKLGLAVTGADGERKEDYGYYGYNYGTDTEAGVQPTPREFEPAEKRA